jgi:superfamily II helicase
MSDGVEMIRSCDYCFAVFEENYWTWCILSNDIDKSTTTLCSACASEILMNQIITISNPTHWILLPELTKE